MEETDDDNFETFFADAPFLGSECSVEEEEEGCGPPPPLWSVPPPPPPPWLSPAEADCSGAGGCSRLSMVDTQVQLQHTFHNLVIIAVCSALLVITLVFLTACIWRSVCRGHHSYQRGIIHKARREKVPFFTIGKLSSH